MERASDPVIGIGRAAPETAMVFLSLSRSCSLAWAQTASQPKTLIAWAAFRLRAFHVQRRLFAMITNHPGSHNTESSPPPLISIEGPQSREVGDDWERN